MYGIGDSVVYPLHGAGTIEAIEEREVSGLMHRYYAMRIPLGDMKVLIPVDSAEKIGVRDIITEEEADKVIEEFKIVECDAGLNWNKRFRENMVKIKSGNIYEVASVVKSLMMRDKQKGLSTGERKMLANAKQILISEIVISKNTTYEVVDKELRAIVENEMLQEQKAD
ncbi:MAG: CarD family transcriptional regulator [Clostridia bacterium]|nr:CarD family transcriptional regulator [Clostridia bacterium]